MEIMRRGDVVELKCGGPDMCVEEVEADGTVVCVWICADGTPRDESYSTDCLKKKHLAQEDLGVLLGVLPPQFKAYPVSGTYDVDLSEVDLRTDVKKIVAQLGAHFFMPNATLYDIAEFAAMLRRSAEASPTSADEPPPPPAPVDDPPSNQAERAKPLPGDGEEIPF